MNIIAIYAAPRTPTDTLGQIINSIFNEKRHSTRTVIAADLNAHHTMWGNDWDDAKGKMLAEAINESHFLLLHNNEHTFIPTDRQKRSSAIDLTAISEDIAGSSSRTVLDTHIGATIHKTIITTIEGPKRQHKETRLDHK
uniref:Endonuclease/exonuclease/phosphatase domain-containing protein n=1 Tax=Anopheles atroparvus TaxID=41427 RepID=A0AAG5DL45_ANOAO